MERKFEVKDNQAVINGKVYNIGPRLDIDLETGYDYGYGGEIYDTKYIEPFYNDEGEYVEVLDEVEGPRTKKVVIL